MAEPGDTSVPSPRDLQARLDAERAGLPFTYWRDGEGDQRILMLGPERERVTIGRRDHSDVALVWDAEVSRTRALLERVGEDWTPGL